MKEFWIDIETISTVSVVTDGLYAHCEDPTLDITMCAYAVDNAPVTLWMEPPEAGTVSECPPEIARHLTDPDTLCWAHNAQYERQVIKAVWGIDVPLERWRDSAVVARWYNLPGALSGFTASTIGTEAGKLDGGNFKPLWTTASLPWNMDDPKTASLVQDMGVYCVRDVASMRDAVRSLPGIPAKTWKEWAVAERINERGVMIDAPFAEAAALLHKAADADNKTLISKVTGGQVKTPRGPAPRQWVEGRLALSAPALLDEDGHLSRAFKKRRSDGPGFYSERRPTFDKPMRQRVRDYLTDSDNAEPDPLLLTFLDAVDEGQNAAVTKFRAAANRVSADARLRGMYIFAGAGQTHRFSSTGVQTHNLLRDTLEMEADYAFRQAVLAAQGDTAPLRRSPAVIEHGLSRALSLSLRATLRATTDHDLIWADWSAVEARGLPWLAGDQRKLQMHRDGIDPYKVNAADLFDKHYDDIGKGPERQAGKVQELALGYGGAAGAFAAMAVGYGVKLTPDQIKRAVTVWRANNPLVVTYWAELHQAAFSAMHNARQLQYVRDHVAYLFAPNVANGALLVALPCGSMLVYPRARIEQVARFEDQEPEACIVFDHPVFGRTALWHGILVENITQAVCASLLREALVRCEEDHLTTVAHTHDEIVVEEHMDHSEQAATDLQAIMETPPAWCPDLPLDAETGRGSRYKIEDAAY